MDSEAVKNAIIKQVQLESNMNNAKQLIEACSAAAPFLSNCFQRCVPKPGSSLSSSESSCATSCMEKYMAAWNLVNASYVKRIQQEVNSHGFQT
ncbi:Tim10/DDP family zinc finger-domain-containing protein [Lasiosphaeris hirsuta]|uniref:Mitochondrial import inner membrane translocase subunit n=1 Tax=Lasiosphaeris hirsuta TaxID=260670 RepID=A0AA40A886_9PEZI|nr:Tim10/DDP family zinc finger-domain-containing protein [Lasiosphaeris hirsuta]